MLPAIITDRKREIDELCRAHHVRRLELFGSAATGDWDPARSDLDFLVKFNAEAPFTTHGDLEDALRSLFERDVDLIFDGSFSNPYLRQAVEESRTHLWGDHRPARPRNGVRVSKSRALKYLWDVQQEADYLTRLSSDVSRTEMMESEHLVRSVPQSLTTIGEALNNLAEQDQAIAERITGHRGYVGMRNILVHQYMRIDWDQVWHTVTKEIPVLVREVDELIAELDPQQEDA